MLIIYNYDLMFKKIFIQISYQVIFNFEEQK